MKEEQQLVAHAKEERRRLRRVFATPEGELVLRDLERRFHTDLPAFQGKAGAYDLLDAMKRDAQREVFLVIRHMLQLAETEQPIEQEHHEL